MFDEACAFQNVLEDDFSIIRNVLDVNQFTVTIYNAKCHHPWHVKFFALR